MNATQLNVPEVDFFTDKDALEPRLDVPFADYWIEEGVRIKALKLIESGNEREFYHLTSEFR